MQDSDETREFNTKISEEILDHALEVLKVHIKLDWTKLENGMGNLTDDTSEDFLMKTLFNHLMELHEATSDALITLLEQYGHDVGECANRIQTALRRRTDNIIDGTPYTYDDLLTSS